MAKDFRSPGTVKIGDRYYQASLNYEVMLQDGAVEIRPKFASGASVTELQNQCPHCHRGDWREVVYHSWQEAINAGLFVEV